MDDLAFLINLQEPTWRATFREQLRPKAYLLAPNNATPANRRRAAELRSARLRLMADNGNFVLILRVASEFRVEADALNDEVAAIERRLQVSARPRDIPSSLRDRYRDLAVRVQDRAESALGEVTLSERRAQQLAIDPNAVIGHESIVMACWIALDIEPAFLAWPRARYRRLNEAVARVAATLDVPDGAYSVASAVSFNTAFDAGVCFARAELPRVALGFGAYMTDQEYTDYLEVGRRTLRLDRRVPRRNVRTAAVMRGFLEGYASVRGKAPEAMHLLGLGTPKLMAVAALAAWGVDSLTFDATSPMRDAVEGTLYVTKPSHQKVRTRKLAWWFATHPETEWDCPCPPCRAFMADHPMDAAAARAWVARTGATSVEKRDLQPRGGLYAAMPIFSEPSGGPLRKAVTEVRVGHNHWAIEQLLRTLRRARKSRAALDAAVRRVIAEYAEDTSLDAYADVALLSYALVSGSPPFDALNAR